MHFAQERTVQFRSFSGE